VHQAVTALKDERQRADFEVYLKKFLMSLDIILPMLKRSPIECRHGASATSCRWPRNATRTKA
jgi:hypothetical protein